MITGDCDISPTRKGAFHNLNDCIVLRTSSPRAPRKLLAPCGRIVVGIFMKYLTRFYFLREQINADYIQDKHMWEVC